MKNIIKFSISTTDNKAFLNILHIDNKFVDFLGHKVWHIDFKNKRIFCEHSVNPCRINRSRFSVLITDTRTHIHKFDNNENLFYINSKKSFTEFENIIGEDFKELFINAIYILVENYKRKVLC